MIAQNCIFAARFPSVAFPWTAPAPYQAASQPTPGVPFSSSSKCPHNEKRPAFSRLRFISKWSPMNDFADSISIFPLYSFIKTSHLRRRIFADFSGDEPSKVVSSVRIFSFIGKFAPVKNPSVVFSRKWFFRPSSNLAISPVLLSPRIQAFA